MYTDGNIRMEKIDPCVFWAALKKGWPAGEGGDCPLLLSSCEAIFAALCPGLGRMWSCWGGSRGGPL